MFDIPASVSVLHLYSFGKLVGSGIKYRPAVATGALQELHIDINTWDATMVRRLARTRMWLLI